MPLLVSEFGKRGLFEFLYPEYGVLAPATEKHEYLALKYEIEQTRQRDFGKQDSPNVLAGVFYGWLDSNRAYLAKGTTFRSYVNYRKQVRL